MKYVKVMFSDESRYNNFKYKVGEVNESLTWNPRALTPKEMGGLNYANVESILRYLHNGDTIYDVIVPKYSKPGDRIYLKGLGWNLAIL